MTVAVCFKCGALKFGAYSECECCHTLPLTDEERSVSIYLTDHFYETDGLEDIGQRIARGEKMPLASELEERSRHIFNRQKETDNEGASW
jgi:hypothetical protein